jgi:hypothetical protein
LGKFKIFVYRMLIFGDFLKKNADKFSSRRDEILARGKNRREKQREKKGRAKGEKNFATFFL